MSEVADRIKRIRERSITFKAGDFVPYGHEKEGAMIVQTGHGEFMLIHLGSGNRVTNTVAKSLRGVLTPHDVRLMGGEV